MTIKSQSRHRSTVRMKQTQNQENVCQCFAKRLRGYELGFNSTYFLLFVFDFLPDPITLLHLSKVAN